ncbi:MAG: hypothetical protein FWD65_04790, partial [Coriobacteriia bacterium]|nr:hypothetical protein [Coriobacteriia bacterium]
TFAKATANPLVFEEVNADGTPTTTPPTYLYTPTGDPNRPVGEGPMVTGQDGLPYIKTDDTTYINTVNDLVIITPDASTLPGGDGDVVQTPTWPSVATQAIQFRVLPIPSQLPGATNVPIQVEFYDPSQETAAQPLRYILTKGSVGNITINSSGQLAVNSTATPIASYGFYVIAADGSFAASSVYVMLPSDSQNAIYQSTSIASYGPVSISKNAQTAFSVGTSPTIYSVTNTTYAIQGSALGCTLTPAGLFTAGNTDGVVTVQVTKSCVNKSSDPIDLQDGTSRTIAAGANYTMTATFEVNVGDSITYRAEAKPYVTQLTLLGVTSWDDVEPAPEYAGGNGSQGMPYQISSIRQLKKFAIDKGANSGYGKYFVLTANMNVDNADTLNGALLGNGFYGTFDGGNHVIENLESSTALFRTVSYGTVKNLGRRGGDSSDAALVYNLGNGADLVHCFNETPISGGNAGGLVYCANSGNATINNCYNTGAVTSNGMSGGLASYTTANGGTLTIINCYNAGAVSGVTAAGGIIGAVNSNGVSVGQTITLTNVFNYGPVIRTATGTNRYFGGIIGWIMGTSGPYQIVNMNNVSYLPGLISYTGVGVQLDTDVGSRPIAPATWWGTGVTVNGEGANTLTGTQTGFLMP